MDENGSFKPMDFGVPHCQKSIEIPQSTCRVQAPEAAAPRRMAARGVPSSKVLVWTCKPSRSKELTLASLSLMLQGQTRYVASCWFTQRILKDWPSWTEIQNGLAQWSSRPLSFAFCTVTGNFLGVARESQTALFVTKWRYLGLAKLVEIWPFETWCRWRKLPLT